MQLYIKWNNINEDNFYTAKVVELCRDYKDQPCAIVEDIYSNLKIFMRSPTRLSFISNVFKDFEFYWKE